MTDTRLPFRLTLPRAGRRAGALAGAVALLAAGFYFVMPAQAPRVLGTPAIDTARAQSQAAGVAARSQSQLAVRSDAASNGALLAEPYETRLTIDRGDTLMALLTGAGLDRTQAHRAIQAMAEVYSPRKLKPGQELTLTVRPDAAGEALRLDALRFMPDAVREIAVRRSAEAADGDAVFTAAAEDKPLTVRNARAEGRIDSSLYQAAVEAGVPQGVLAEMIRLFSFDVDFQRDIQPGDRFALLYEDLRTEDGAAAETGDILIAEMRIGDSTKRYYRFEDDDGFVDYFDAEGRSVRKALLRTPVDGARLSSGFGKRRHPISGYTRMHKGVDFAAPTGTPIYAAGDGVVEAAGWLGGYGNYVRVRHNSTYKTAYAHLSRIEVKPGQRVSQRDVIGRIGSTGRSTGPHLHYEVHKNGRQVNPHDVELPTGKTLSGATLARFQDVRAKLETRYAEAYRLDGKETAAAGACTTQAAAAPC